MKARWLWLVLCVMVCFTARATDALPSQIYLASEDWEDYTAADGHGLAWDVLREVFEPAGVRLDIRTEPYTRSIGLVQRREVDAVVGCYFNEVDKILFPRWNYDSDHIYTFGLASKPVPTLASLGNYRLAWVRGYRFEKYLPNIRRYNQIERRTGILPMLKQDRADFYIDALTEINAVLKDAPNPSLYRRSHLLELPLYLGFANTPQGRKLLALYDQRMELLVKNDRLRPIFERWKQPYPFEEGARPARQ